MWGRRLRRRLGTLTVGLSLVAIAPSSVLAASGHGVSRAVLDGPSAHGTAIFVVYPHHAEIDMRAHGLSRDRNPLYLAWMIDKQGDARLGGLFFRSRHTSFRGSLVILGSKRQSIHKAKAAEHLAVTAVSHERAKQQIEKARRSHFNEPMDITGAPLMKGKTEPLSYVGGP